MNEREQVISNLLYMKRDCLEGSDTDKTLDRAIALLKAQEQDFKKIIEKGNVYECPWCGEEVFSDTNPNYCGYCGKPVKWE